MMCVHVVFVCGYHINKPTRVKVTNPDNSYRGTCVLQTPCRIRHVEWHTCNKSIEIKHNAQERSLKGAIEKGSARLRARSMSPYAATHNGQVSDLKFVPPLQAVFLVPEPERHWHS